MCVCATIDELLCTDLCWLSDRARGQQPSEGLNPTWRAFGFALRIHAHQ